MAALFAERLWTGSSPFLPVVHLHAIDLRSHYHRCWSACVSVCDSLRPERAFGTRPKHARIDTKGVAHCVRHRGATLVFHLSRVLVGQSRFVRP
jgi:hypothetical protein